VLICVRNSLGSTTNIRFLAARLRAWMLCIRLRIRKCIRRSPRRILRLLVFRLRRCGEAKGRIRDEVGFEGSGGHWKDNYETQARTQFWRNYSHKCMT
jgi:hypothetical protein